MTDDLGALAPPHGPDRKTELWREPPEYSYSEQLRRAASRSTRLLAERDRHAMQVLLLQQCVELLDASVARLHLLGSDDFWQVTAVEPQVELPALASQMEAALLPRALARSKSLISSHPLLDDDLRDLADSCARMKITTHLLLIRAHQRTYGAVGVHWLGKERPAGFEARRGFYYYVEGAGLAVAAAYERAKLERELAVLRDTAFRDRLTGLPNAEALERELQAHATTRPFSVLVLDFDGLRAANTAFGHLEGGDTLIRLVGASLGRLGREGEFAARLHTAGDEFAVLLPGRDERAAHRRSAEVEAGLESLTVPERFDGIYRGASVGAATRQPGETPGQTLGRAISAMRARKRERAARRCHG